MKTGDDIPRVTALREHDVCAGFTPEFQSAFRADPALVAGSRVASSNGTSRGRYSRTFSTRSG
jgi:hypothetical protein